jgi:hypothetical protein
VNFDCVKLCLKDATMMCQSQLPKNFVTAKFLQAQTLLSFISFIELGLDHSFGFSSFHLNAINDSNL